MTLEVVYGASVQGDDPSPEDPQEIRSVEEIHIVVHDADDVTVMERTITPPRPLNKIGAYADTLDVIGGVWKYALGAEEFNGTENWVVSESSLGAYTFQVQDASRFGIYADTFAGISNRYHYAGSGWSVGSVAPSDRGAYLSPQRIRILWASMGISTAAAMKSLLASWAAADAPLRVVAAYAEEQTESVNAADLAFLRSLYLLPVDHHIVMTDQDGNDISYLMDYKVQTKPSYTASEIGYGQTDVGSELGRLSSEKVDKAQGASAAGKWLGTDADGNVVAEDLPYSNGSNAGVVKASMSSHAAQVSATGYFSSIERTLTQYLENLSASAFVSKGTLENLLNANYIQRGYILQTVTIAAASWSGNSVTVNVTGVTASNLVQLTPADKASADAWAVNGVFCTAQGNGTLTFSCVSTPTTAINMGVIIW